MNSLETHLSQVTSKDIAQIINAIEHLAGFSDVWAVTAIQNAFFHYQPAVREAAAQAAGINLDEALLDALLSLLDDKSPQVRLAAVTASGRFAKKGHIKKVVLALLEHQPEPQTEKAVENIILSAGPGVLPILEIELNSLDKIRRERAIDILPHMGDLGVMTIINNLSNLNLWESKQTAKKLGGLNHPMLVDYFLDMLDDPEVKKRSFAMETVISSKTTIKAIQAVGQVLLNGTDQHMRLDAAYYLKWVGDPIVLKFLDQYDPSKEKGLYGRWIKEIVRDTRILLDLQDKPLIKILALLFTGERHERSLACVEISRRKDPVAIPFLARALLLEKAREVKGNILVSLRDLEAVEAVDSILSFFQKGGYSGSEDALALRILGELYHPKAMDYLRERANKPILNDIPAEKEPIESARGAVEMAEHRMDFMRQAWFTVMEEGIEKRVFIALQLAMRGDDRGIDLLMEHFNNIDSRAIRYQTLRALGESGSVFVLPFLLGVLKSPDERMIWHALNAIGQLSLSKAPAEVSAMLLDESPVVRMASLFALGSLKDEQTIPFILNRIEDKDPFVRAVMLQTLGAFPFCDDWLTRLDHSARDASTWVRLETARLLQGEHSITSREALIQMLRDENVQVRLFATQLASYHLKEDLRPALEYCASIKGGSARRNARQLLERLNWQMWSKDPELLAMKKKEAIQQKQEKVHKKHSQELRKRVADKRKVLREEGWVSLLVTQVAGAAYVDWETLYAGLEIGELLGLKREPGNPHDDNAILVLDEEENKLG